MPQASEDYKNIVNFYHTANASKAVKLSSGKRVTFDVYKYFAGAWLGIAAVEDPETIEGLEELVIKPKSGITRITKEEFESLFKKKALPTSLRLSPASPSPRQPQPAPLVLVDGRRAVLLAGGDDKAAAPILNAEPKVYESADEVLQLGEVEPTDHGPVPPKRDMGQRSARANGPPSERPKYRSDDTPEEKEAIA